MFDLTRTRNSMPSLISAIRAFNMLLAIMLAGGALWALAASDRKIVYAEEGGGVQTTAAGANLPYAPGAPDCGPGWNVVSSPNTGDTFNDLHDVVAISANDVWAVGAAINGGTKQDSYFTLAEHWNGSAWSVVPTPANLGDYDNFLYDVAAVSTNDVWAVGYYYNSQITYTLILHWNGSAWSVVSSPNQGSGNNTLSGIAEVSANDIWAVGSYTNGSSSNTLFEHWNGSAWSVFNSTQAGGLGGVAVVSANDIWAVGAISINGGYFGLTEHWNGSAWSLVAAANPGSSNSLTKVTAVSTNDVWAVGSYGSPANTLFEHWNGSAWNVVSSPNPGSFENYLEDITAVSTNDVWAVGLYRTSIYVNPELSFIEHWNGSAWSLVTSANPSTSEDILRGISAISANDIWAVGQYGNSDPSEVSYTLAEHYNPCSGAPTSTPVHIPTATRTPSVPTPTPVSTQCPIQFTDVPEGSPFYAYVRCLACRNIVGGYSTTLQCTTGVPCYLPGNNVTRGQAAKFISNAANYQDVISTSQQTFTDVPPSSTFWIYVERAVLHGVVSGYSTSPPCTTGTPCYLPANNVTRGQTAKFISNAFFPNCSTPLQR